MIYRFKAKGITPEDFNNNQNPIDLLINLRDSNLNPREVLKDQINLNSDLGKLKKGNKKSKSKDQISVVQNVQNFFDLREKIIDFFRDYSFLI